jgi:pyruvate formate lyase activating enzyme
MATAERLTVPAGHPALLWESLPGGRARCGICVRRCVIADGKRGWCGTRVNRDGRVFSLIYGQVASIAVSPIEKKPLFHFYPGSRWLSLGSLGCNFRCPGCQNWDIAHALAKASSGTPGTVRLRETGFLAPRQLVALAREQRCLGISWTYNEPTLWFEYVLEGTQAAREAGLLTNLVTNGSITPEALDLVAPWLDSFRVDLKGFTPKLYRRLARLDDFSGILSVTSRAKHRWGLWVETVTNLIPGFNDDDEQLAGIASWIRDELGPETPWHVTRFVPHLRLERLEPTPIDRLERARNIGLTAGLKYVYLGNVAGHGAENTYCAGCGELLIRRYGLAIVEFRLCGGGCPRCGAGLPGRFGGVRVGNPV